MAINVVTGRRQFRTIEDEWDLNDLIDRTWTFFENAPWSVTMQQYCLEIGISDQTRYNLEDKYPEYERCIIACREMALNRFLEYGAEHMGEKDFNVNLYNFLGRCIHGISNARTIRSKLLKSSKTTGERAEAIINETASGNLTPNESSLLAKTVLSLAQAMKISEMQGELDEIKAILGSID